MIIERRIEALEKKRAQVSRMVVVLENSPDAETEIAKAEREGRPVIVVKFVAPNAVYT